MNETSVIVQAVIRVSIAAIAVTELRSCQALHNWRKDMMKVARSEQSDGASQEAVSKTLRIQVPNNQILTQNPKPNYWVLGPSGKPVVFRVQGSKLEVYGIL